MEIVLPPDFKEFLRLLRTHKVKYLLIGGHAVAYHGYPRATQDMDIWIAVHHDNAEQMVEVLKEFGFGTPKLTTDLFLQEKSIVRMGVPPMRIEVVTAISGVDFEDCYAARITDQIDGVDVDLINLPHLRLNKRASGRHKDLDDLEHLM